MTLLAKGIRQAMGRPDLDQRLTISPILDPEKQIGPGTVDLRLGTEFLEFNRSGRGILDVLNKNDVALRQNAYERRTVVALGDGLALHPGQFILGSTLEFISMPPDIIGQVVSRSSWGRLGLLVATAVVVQPGYKGVLTLELVNTGGVPIILRPGSRVAQIQLWKAEEDELEPYVSSGKYQVPVGPEAARLSSERVEASKLDRIGREISHRGPRGDDQDFAGPASGREMSAAVGNAPEHGDEQVSVTDNE
jgi:dCTP deaminase